MYIKLTQLYFAIFVALLIFGACKKEVHLEPLGLNKKKIDIQKVDRYFQKCSNKERLLLLDKIYDESHQNQTELDHWLQKNLINKYGQYDFQQPVELKGVLLGIYEANNSELSSKLALQIISDKRSVVLPVKPSAYAVMLDYYDLLQEKDSVQKYLHLLGQNLKYDSANWLRVTYQISKAIIASKESKNLDALIRFKEALNYTKPDQIKNLRTIHLNLALLYLKFNIKSRAKYHINKAIVFGVQNFPLDILNNLGIVLSKTKEFKKAEASFKRALALANQKGLSILKAQTFANFANHRRREGRYNEALILMKKSDSICNIMGIEMGILINQINRSELYLEIGAFDLLAEELDAIGSKALETNQSLYKTDYYRMRFSLYDALGNKDLANEYFRKYKSIEEQKNGDHASSLITEWELARNESERSKDKLQLYMAQRKQQNTELIFGLSFVLILLGIVFIQYLRRSNQNQLKQQQTHQKLTYDLELKSKELLTESLKNMTIKNLKNEINTQLTEVIQELPEPYQDKFQDIKRLLKTASSNQVFEEFESRFNGIYEGFYTKLREIAPDLTLHELKICALLRLNISSKEMAILTNRTIGTIDNTRSMIRKKLGLTDNDNLQEFILTV